MKRLIDYLRERKNEDYYMRDHGLSPEATIKAIKENHSFIQQAFEWSASRKFLGWSHTAPFSAYIDEQEGQGHQYREEGLEAYMPYEEALTMCKKVLIIGPPPKITDYFDN